MRITTGKYKGRIVKAAKAIRPTQNKVRKAIFDILGDVEGLSFLELFAGSGAVGFEALSRGAREVVLVEYNRDCQIAIRNNIEILKDSSCSLYPRQADIAVAVFHKEGRLFDIIFCDPPYRLGLAKKILQTLSDYVILAPGGFVVIQHEKKEILPDNLGVFNLIKKSFYGSTVLSFYKKN